MRLLKTLLEILKALIASEREQMLYRGLYVDNETPRALGTKISWRK